MQLGAAPDQGASESDEARYSRHLEILLKFYAKHDSSKTQAQVVAIIAKRKGAAAALDEDIFVEVCGKLENKYGENPLVLFAPVHASDSSASAVDPEMADLLQDDREEEADELGLGHIARRDLERAAHEPAQLVEVGLFARARRATERPRHRGNVLGGRERAFL